MYAPHSDRPESEKDVFCDLLEKAIGNCPKYDAVMVLGDFNAKVGSESGLKGTVGKFSLHRESNKNGVRLTELALSRGLVVSSTRFSHLQIHMGTWKIPGKSRSNQIDHVLMDSRHASCILDIRSSNLNTLDDSLPLQVNEHWKKCAGIINKAATKHLKNDESRTRNKWYDYECEAICNVKNQARRKMLHTYTRSNREDYKQKRKEAYKLIRKKKRQQLKDEISNLENLRNNQEIRKFYKNLNRHRNGSQITSKPSIVYDRNGGLLTNKTDVLNRWVEHFDELLNGDSSSSPPILPTKTKPRRNNISVF